MADEKNELKICEGCGKPGGRLMVDPFREEIYGERVTMRLHERCAQERRDDI